MDPESTPTTQPTSASFVPQGKYSVGGVSECLDCDSEKFNSNDGASSCSPCDPGSVPNSATGATGCTDCTAGKFAAFGVTICSDCNSKGQYSSSAAAAACSAAPAGKKPNSNRQDVENCPAGSNDDLMMLCF